MATTESHPLPVTLAAESISYDRSALGFGILHLGMGNFHRSHQASVVHEVLEAQPGNWMIRGTGMLAGDSGLIDAMRQQNGLYTLTEQAASKSDTRVVGSIGAVLLAPHEPELVVQGMADSNTKIVSLTITEAGYCNTASGDLNTEDPKIQDDLRDGSMPQTGLGYLFAGLHARRLAGGEPVTVMSCDNLLGNGDLTRRLLLQFAAEKDPETAKWLENEANVSFPNSMVDRITPAAGEEFKQWLAEERGLLDLCPVVCEDFRQWIIEDKFAGPRPAFEIAEGVQLVSDVEPYEALKTRLLNGSHSALAYTAYLMGELKVDIAIQHPLLNQFIRRYMDEDVIPGLPEVPGINVEEYKRTLLTRFANPAISDQIERLAKDGAAKIAIYMVPALKDQLQSGGSIRHMAFALAAWARYLQGKDEQGRPISINDPVWESLKRPIKTAADLVGIQEIFGSKLSNQARLIKEIDRQLVAISTLGTEKALTEMLAGK